MVTIAVRATAGRYRVPSALQTYPNNRSVTSGGNRSPIVSDHVGRDDGTRETAHRLKVPMDRTTREALHRSRGYGAVLLQHGLRQCDRDHCPAYLWSSNLPNTSLYQRLALRSWPRSKLARRLLLFSWCVMRAED